MDALLPARDAFNMYISVQGKSGKPGEKLPCDLCFDLKYRFWFRHGQLSSAESNWDYKRSWYVLVQRSSKALFALANSAK